MNGVHLFLLGRTLMRIGEQAMPAPPDGDQRGTRAVLIVLSDIVENAGTTISEITARTGMPQSQVSTAVARLKTAGSIVTGPDAHDRRRMLIRRAPTISPRVAEVRGQSIDEALVAALGDDKHLREIKAALDLLAKHLSHA
jgi:DNA-binding MarR family transcriptional regulator